MPAKIDVVTNSLQTKGYKLSSCFYNLDAPIEAVREDNRTRRAPSYISKLGKKSIAPCDDTVANLTLETAVIKIQKGQSSELTTDERDAAKSLLLSSVSVQEDNLRGISSMKERLEKRRKVAEQDIYMDCRFILSTVAEVECLLRLTGL